MSNFRRKLITAGAASGGGGGGDLPEYIQNGLMLNLDGTNKYPDGTYVWCDPASGYKFNGYNVTEITNGFRFDGTASSYLYGNKTFPKISGHTMTYEVVVKKNTSDTSWTALFMLNGGDNWSTDGLGVVADNTNTFIYANRNAAKHDGKTNHAFLGSLFDLQTLSISSEKAYKNGAALTVKSGWSEFCTPPSDSSAYPRISGRDYRGNPTGNFKGDFYALRVYNRILTEEEILYNANIDFLKYNI